MFRTIVWLTLGAFALGTESFMVAGLLPAMATDLGTTVPMTGHLVTAFSLAYALGSPVIAVASGGVERKRVLLAAMTAFAIGNLLAAIAPDYKTLMAARVLLGLAAGLFMPTAGAYAAAIGGPERRGRAISYVYVGLTGAILIGVPLGAVVGGQFGWRATFYGVAGLASLAALGIAIFLKPMAGMKAIGFGERLAVMRRPEILSVLLVTVIGLAGAFCVYTYLAPYLGAVVGVHGAWVAPFLFLFGLGGTLGNLGGGWAADRFHPKRLTTIVLSVLMATFIALALAEDLARPFGAIVAVVAIAVWGIDGWAFPSIQQARLVWLDPKLAPISLSLNASATYLGVSIGASLGSLAIAYGSVGTIGWIAAACVALALVLVRRPLRTRPRCAAEEAAALAASPSAPN